MSSCAPAYVKTNQVRFPRTESTRSIGQEILSPFAPSNSEADARVFRALMRHLRAIDGARHSVLMVQVENEIGMIPTARDHSALADSLYARPVPPELMTFAPSSPGPPIAGILHAQEGRYENGRWVSGRWLNGDQTHQGRHIRLEAHAFSMQRVKLYRYR
jgi:beta-galactosidase GanA